MMRRSVILTTGAVVIALLAIGASWFRLDGARDRLATAQSSLVQARSDGERVLALRAARQTIAAGAQPENDVIARVNATLADAGLPRSTLRSLVPEAVVSIRSGGSSASSGSGPAYNRQSLRLTLGDLSVVDLGRFLLHWRETQPLWTITRLELIHQRGAGSNAGHYDVTLVLSTIYLADGDGRETTS